MLNIFIIICILSAVSGATIVVPTQCNVKDFNCKKEMYKMIINQGLDGNPSLNIPKADPMNLNKATFTLPNLIQLTLEEGVATGFKNCDYDQMKSYFDQPTFYTILNLICNIEINGQYTIEVPKSVLLELGGEDTTTNVITAIGKGKATIDRLHVNLYCPFEFEWRDNDAYLHVKSVRIDHIAEKITFSIDGLDVGNKVNDEKISNYLSEHASELNLISPVIDKVQEFFEVFTQNYIRKLPAKNLYSNNLMNLA